MRVSENEYLSDTKEKVKYFEGTIWKRGIGKKFSQLYVEWADCFRNDRKYSDAFDVIQKVNLKDCIVAFLIARIGITIRS